MYKPLLQYINPGKKIEAVCHDQVLQTSEMGAANCHMVPNIIVNESIRETLIDGAERQDDNFGSGISQFQEKSPVDPEVTRLTQELALAKQGISQREIVVRQLAREVDKLKSVLDQTAEKSCDLLATINEEAHMTGQIGLGDKTKKHGVSGESYEQSSVMVRYEEKDFRSKQLIRDAILENDFLKNLSSVQVKEIVESMYVRNVEPGTFVIKEGESGQHLYVTADGTLEVIKQGEILGTLELGRTFGELALLYNCKRTASVRALTSATFWALDRPTFQAIMMKTSVRQHEETLAFLLSVPLFRGIAPEMLMKVADAFNHEYYLGGEHILREAEIGKTFFIIKSGRVIVNQLLPGDVTPTEIRNLDKGDYFGEKALLSEEFRTAGVVAMPPGVEVLTLDRVNFIGLIGNINELKQKDYGDDKRRTASASPYSKNEAAFSEIKLSELETVSTLGVGGFGRVELVVWTYDRSKSFALKCLNKTHIVATKQQEHVYSEKRIMEEVNCRFICRLFNTYTDSKYVYMLMEPCLGGELWSILRDRGSFNDQITRFCVGCVILSLEYLHARGIIYRDLKPENLLLDSDGYVKMTDFGFAKKIGLGRKTWTFCGTPEYVAPEVILNKGHDMSVDCWSLGILMFELLTGSPPFYGNDPMKTYNVIIRGIEMVEFPKKIGKTAYNLIKTLCRENPAERLGYGNGGMNDVKSNIYFQGFHWDGLLGRSLKPPIMPTVKGPTDVSNFDSYPRDVVIPPNELSGWDWEF